MANTLLAYPNRADECTLSGGAWSVALPLAHLQARDIRKFARSSNAAAASTQFDCALPAPRSIRLVSLVNTNLSRDAQYRIRWASDAAFTSVVYDSGVVDMYAAGLVPFGEFEWEEEGFWDGRLSSEQIKWYPKDLIHILPVNTWGQYLRVEVFDTTNADGHVQIGRLFVGKGFQPEHNISYGRSVSHSSGTEVFETIGRRELFNEGPLVRQDVVSMDWLSQDEGVALFDMDRQLGVSGEVFYSFDPAAARNLMRWSFLARMEQISPLTHPMFNVHTKQFAIKEII